MKLSSLQAYRAIAAILVVLYHVTEYTDTRFHAAFLANLFGFGYTGVDFFFVLSGFIIFHVHRADIGQPARLGTYIAKRFLRIFPIYWMITGVKLVAVLVVPGYAKDYERQADTILKSIVLFPQDHLPLIGAAWTLSHELLFYVVFAACIVVGVRFAVTALTTWAALIVTWSMWLSDVANSHGLSNYLIAFVFNERNLEFIMGCGSAWLISHGVVARGRLLLAFGVGFFVAAGMWIDLVGSAPALALTLTFGLASFMIVTASSTLELAGKLRVPRVLVFIGDASYSVYLLAFAFVNLVGLFVFRVISGMHIQADVLGILMASAAVAGGVATYLVAEKPMLRIVRAQRARRAIGGPPLKLGLETPAT